MDPIYSGLPGSDWESCQNENGPDRRSQDLGDLLSHVLSYGSSADHLRFRERIQCQECEQFMEEPCWYHARSVPNENVVPFALASLPQMLYLDICHNSPTGKIVLAKQMISSHTIFGPMIAPATDIFRDSYFYAFPSPNDDGTQYFQLESELFSNWMRYVRFAENPTEANLAVYLRGSQVVFVTTRMILPGEELQVCYSVKYAKTIGRTAVLEDDKENVALSTDYVCGDIPEVPVFPETPLVRDVSEDSGSSCSQSISDGCGVFSRCTVLQPLVDDDTVIFETAPVTSEAALSFSEELFPSSTVVGDGDNLTDLAPLMEIVSNVSDAKPPIPSAHAEIGSYYAKLCRNWMLHPVQQVSNADPCERNISGTSATDSLARKLTLRCPETPLVRNVSEDPGSSCPQNFSDGCTISDLLVDDDAAISETAPVISEAARTFSEKIFISASVGEDHIIGLTTLAATVPELSTEKSSLCQPLSSIRADSPEIGCFRPVQKVSDADPCGRSGTSATETFARKLTLRSAAKTSSTMDLTASQSLCLDPVVADIGNGALMKNDLDFSQTESDADSDWQPVFCDEDSDSDYETREHNTKRVRKNNKTVHSRSVADEPEVASLPSSAIDNGQPSPPQENLYKYSLVRAGRERRRLSEFSEVEERNVAKEFSCSNRATATDIDHENGQDRGESKAISKRKKKKNENREECPVCHSVVRRLAEHLRENHVDYRKHHYKAVCEMCGDSFPTQGALNCHITKYHRPSGETITAEMLETALEYMRTTGFLSYFCQNCLKYFPSKAILDLHEFSHRVLEDYKDRTERQCPVCDFTGTSFSDVVLHTKEHAIGPNGRKQCLFCPDKLTELSHHFKIKHTEYREIISKDWQFECEQCHTKFFSKKNLDTHIRVIHHKQQCIYCAIQFTSHVELAKHLPEHKKDGVFPCASCPKTFPAYVRFRVHYTRTHNVNRIHLCEICQFVCPNRAYVKVHMQSHKKDFRFVCKECGKRFHASRYLRGHVRWVHEGNLKDYKKNYLKKRKEKEQEGLVGNYVDPRRKFAFDDFPYKCHECHLGYMRRGTLMNHVKQKHPETDPESVPL